jgi:hypothetical protein
VEKTRQRSCTISAQPGGKKPRVAWRKQAHKKIIDAIFNSFIILVIEQTSSGKTPSIYQKQSPIKKQRVSPENALRYKETHKHSSFQEYHKARRGSKRQSLMEEKTISNIFMWCLTSQSTKK